MKKVLIIFLALFTQITQSSPECWGYTGKRFLRQEPFGLVACDCNCEQQYHTNCDDKRGRTCLRCGHKLLQSDPITKKTILLDALILNELLE